MPAKHEDEIPAGADQLRAHEHEEDDKGEEFGELLKYTGAGYLLGLVAGAILDYLGLQRSGLGQGLVRTLSGESESIFEGLFALKRRLTKATATMAEAYGWGKLLGMTAPWVVDAASRWFGVDVDSAAGFYIPYLYAMSDQIGANVSGYLFLRRQHGTAAAAARAYVRNPLMLTSFLVVVLVPLGLLSVRLAGFSPTTQIYTALETIVANICWLPPLVAWLWERERKKPDDSSDGK